MSDTKPTFPAVYMYRDPNPTRYDELTTEQIVAQVQLQAAIPPAGHFIDGEHVYVTGRKVTDPYDRNDNWQYRGEFWEMLPVTAPDGVKYSQTFPERFRRVDAANLRRYVDENRRRIHEKTFAMIQPLLEETDPDRMRPEPH